MVSAVDESTGSEKVTMIEDLVETSIALRPGRVPTIVGRTLSRVVLRLPETLRKASGGPPQPARGAASAAASVAASASAAVERVIVGIVSPPQRGCASGDGK